MYVAEHYPGLDSSNIYFSSDADRIDQKFITTINKTTALLTMELPPVGSYTYSCNLEVPDDVDPVVCFNVVFVACKQSYSFVINFFHIFSNYIFLQDFSSLQLYYL